MFASLHGRQRGFSLTELMLIVAIAGTLMAIGRSAHCVDLSASMQAQ